MNMKKTIVGIAAFATTAMFIVGCDNLPTPEKMTTVSTIVGRTAGYACELAKAKPEVKTAILQVLDVTSKVVPAEGQTFTEAWACTRKLQDVEFVSKPFFSGGRRSSEHSSSGRTFMYLSMLSCYLC